MASRITSKFTGPLKADKEYAQGSFGALTANLNYIDTFIFNENTEFEMWASFPVFGSDERVGFVDTTTSTRFYIGRSSSTEWIVGHGSENVTIIGADSGVHLFKNNKNGFYIDGVLKHLYTGTWNNPSINAWLLGRNVPSGRNFANMNMYKAEITHNGSVHAWNFDQDTESVVYTIDGVLQTPPTIQGTVTTDQWGEGAEKQVTQKYSVVEADKTLTDQWYDHTDPTNPVALVKPIPSANTIDNDQEYTKADAEETLLYDEALTGECKTKATEYTGGVI